MKMNEVIRKYRKERGLTQEQVAGYLGVSTPVSYTHLVGCIGSG